MLSLNIYNLGEVELNCKKMWIVIEAKLDTKTSLIITFNMFRFSKK